MPSSVLLAPVFTTAESSPGSPHPMLLCGSLYIPIVQGNKSPTQPITHNCLHEAARAGDRMNRTCPVRRAVLRVLKAPGEVTDQHNDELEDSRKGRNVPSGNCSVLLLGPSYRHETATPSWALLIRAEKELAAGLMDGQNKLYPTGCYCLCLAVSWDRRIQHDSLGCYPEWERHPYQTDPGRDISCTGFC